MTWQSGRLMSGIFARTLVLSSLLIVVTVFFGFYIGVKYHRSMQERSLANQASALASSIDLVAGSALVTDADLSRKLDEKIESVIEHCRKIIQRADHILYIVITRADGSSLVHSRPGQLNPNFPTQDWEVRSMNGMWTPLDSAAISHGAMAELAPVVSGCRKVGQVMMSDLIRRRVFHYTFSSDSSSLRRGWVHLGLDVAQFENDMRAAYRIASLVAGGALLFGCAASYFFARRISGSIKDLQRYAQQIADGAMNAKLEYNAGGELGDLAASITSMKESLIMSHKCNETAILQAASLREKEVLLREIHHRVKNNMQILSSLLRLQRRRVDHALVRGALYDSELRIRAMSLIHEKLYQSESLADVEMGGYVDTLCKELVRMEGGARLKGLSIQISNVCLGLDTALPCGLIINELVSNSLKYAFPEDKSGTVTIKLSHAEKLDYELVVSDDGEGMKKAPDLVNSKSLGLRLVGMLVEQLHGTVSFSSGKGTTVTIRFRESKYRKRV
jgi:two-component sensor histidine kinase